MKLKHNKKRNTAFLFEALVKEITKSIISNNLLLKEELVNVVKIHFGKGKVLRQELDLIKNISESKEMDLYTADKLIQETKKDYLKLDKQEIFNEQTAIINRLNKIVGPEIFSNFIPNYRHLATIQQIFSDDIPAKQRVLLERNIIGTMVKKNHNIPKTKEDMPHIDKLVYKKIVENFNTKYKDELLPEQKMLLNNFIVYHGSEEVKFNVFLNEELSRLYNIIEESKEKEIFLSDKELATKLDILDNVFESFKEQRVDENMVYKIMQIQKLVKEIAE